MHTRHPHPHPQVYSTSWLLTLFAGDLPLETALRLWDVVFLLEGEEGGASELQGAGCRAPGGASELQGAGCRAPGGASELQDAGYKAPGGASVLLAAALALLRVQWPAIKHACAGEPSTAALSDALRIGPHSLQPSSTLGVAFLATVRAELTTLHERVPLDLLRAQASRKVLARLALVQSVRDGVLPVSSLRESAVDDEMDISVSESTWLRQRLQPPPRMRRGPAWIGRRLARLRRRGGAGDQLLEQKRSSYLVHPSSTGGPSRADEGDTGSAEVELEGGALI